MNSIMLKKLVRLTVFVLVLSLPGSALAVLTNWTNATGNDLWSDYQNWEGGVIPDPNIEAYINSPLGPTITELDSSCQALYVGTIPMISTTVTVDSGSLWVRTFATFATTVYTQCFLTINGGTATMGKSLTMSTSMLSESGINLFGGTLNVDGALSLASGGDSTMVVDGGDANIAVLHIGVTAASNGHVQLDDGTVTAGLMTLGLSGGAGTIDITGGSLFLSGDLTTDPTLQGYISSGKITAYGGADPRKTVKKEYISATDKTRLYAHILSVEQAYNPSPADGDAVVGVNSNLGWSAGTGAVSHDVYLGTDPNVLTNVSFHQPGLTFEPGRLDYATRYYWRVDEFDGSSTVTGDVWYFTTIVPVCTPPLVGDVDGDCKVDFDDLSLMVVDWLRNTEVVE